MPDYTVRAYGTDSSGRTIYLTAYMHDWWEHVVADLGFRPTIVQGAFMTRNGGGASESAGYHDQAGCIDLRVWDRTADEVDQMIRACRRYGAGAWERDHEHGGMDPHVHLVLGTDQPLASGAAWQWQEYLAGRDGLAARGRDYEWRPSPLVTTPPEYDMPSPKDWTAEDYAALMEKLGKPLVKAIWDAAVDSAGTVARKALRKAAGL